VRWLKLGCGRVFGRVRFLAAAIFVTFVLIMIRGVPHMTAGAVGISAGRPFVPFGCGVFREPNETSEQPSKADPRLFYGLGGEETDQYLARNVDDFIDEKLHYDVPGGSSRICSKINRGFEFDRDERVHFPFESCLRTCRLYFRRQD
jgi:hypothetical protein